jgi:hypothetical protein
MKEIKRSLKTESWCERSRRRSPSDEAYFAGRKASWNTGREEKEKIRFAVRLCILGRLRDPGGQEGEGQRLSDISHRGS